MAKVVGVGGVFFKSEDPEKLGAWYQKWLAVPVEPPYGASFRPDTIPPGGLTVWGPFRMDTDYFSPSKREFMLNLMVDDLDGALAQVRDGGAEIVALHVIHDPIEMPGSYRRSQSDVLRPTEELAAEKMDRFVTTFTETHPELQPLDGLKTRLVEGIPETRILEFADGIDARSGEQHPPAGKSAPG